MGNTCTHASFLISLVYLSGSFFHHQLCLLRNGRWVQILVAQSGYVLLSSLKWLLQRPPWLHLQLLKPITISVAVTGAVNAALANRCSSTNDELTPVPSTSIVHPNDQAVDDEVTALTGVSGTLESCTLSGTEDGPRQLFASIAVSLGSRVSAKIKAKIWQNEYMDFGALLALGPRLKSSHSHSRRGILFPLHLEPVQSSKKVQTITQWVTAFNTFVAIYVERVAPGCSKINEVL